MTSLQLLRDLADESRRDRLCALAERFVGRQSWASWSTPAVLHAVQRVIEQGQLVVVDDRRARAPTGSVRPAGSQGPDVRSASARKPPTAAWIWIDVVDERGESVATRFQLETTDGRRIDEPLAAGNCISLAGLIPGTCRLVLPEIDRRSQRVSRRTPIQVSPAQIQYRPGQPLVLDTDRSHEVVIPAFRDLWMETPLDHQEDQALRSHQFILRGSDGYQVTGTIDDDLSTDQDLLTLTFANLYPGPTYALFTQHPSGERRVVFEAQPFDALFPRARTDVNDPSCLSHR